MNEVVIQQNQLLINQLHNHKVLMNEALDGFEY